MSGVSLMCFQSTAPKQFGKISHVSTFSASDFHSSYVVGNLQKSIPNYVIIQMSILLMLQIFLAGSDGYKKLLLC